MKSILLYIGCLLITGINSIAQCVNGGFEMGDFTSYTLYNSVHNTPTFDMATFSPVGPTGFYHKIVTTTDTDPWFSQLSTVRSGNYSARVGLTQSGSTASMMGYTFVVTDQNKYFSFNAAMVLNYSSEHPATNQQASVQYFMCKGTQPTLDRNFLIGAPNARNIYYASNRNHNEWDGMYLEPGTNGTSWLQYRNWSRYCIDLSNYVGETVSIFFIGSGCTANLHGGYWYIDNLCGTPLPEASFTMNPVLCHDTRVTALNTSQNHEWYSWTIERMSGNLVVPNTQVVTEFPTSQTGIDDLTTLYNAGGKSFIPGGRYQITLAAGLECGPAPHGQLQPGFTSTMSTIIEIPLIKTVDAGPDLFTCCFNAPIFGLLGSWANDPTFQYEWYIENGPLISNDFRPNVGPMKSTTYFVRATTPNGCIATDVMKFVHLSDYTATLSESCTTGPCNKKLTVNITLPPTSTDPNVNSCVGDNPGYDAEKMSQFTYAWNDGQATQTIDVAPGTTPGLPTGMKRYTVTVSNGCYTKTLTYTLNTYHGNFPTIAAVNAFTPNGDGLNDVFKVLQLGLDPNVYTPNAYNAYRGEFVVRNRAGQIVRQQTIENCGPEGLVNGAFTWDGKYNGVLQPVEVYVYTFTLYNCTNTGGTLVYSGQIFLIL